MVPMSSGQVPSKAEVPQGHGTSSGECSRRKRDYNNIVSINLADTFIMATWRSHNKALAFLFDRVQRAAAGQILHKTMISGAKCLLVKKYIPRI